MGHFIWWQSLPFEDFQRVIDMTNQVNVLLASHWVAMMMAMSFLHAASIKVNEDSKKRYKGITSARTAAQEKGKCTEPWYYWLVCLNRWVNEEHKRFNLWPQWVQERLDEDAQYFYY